MIFSHPFAERVSWWGRPKPTPASQTSWKGEPSITVLGPPRGLHSASRYRLTPPVSDICHSQRGSRFQRTRAILELTPPLCFSSFGLSDGFVLWAVQVHPLKPEWVGGKCMANPSQGALVFWPWVFGYVLVTSVSLLLQDEHFQGEWMLWRNTSIPP